MSGPWEKYRTKSEKGPWEKYASSAKPVPEINPTVSVVDNGFSVSEMVQNIPESAANLVGGIVDAVSSPVETGKALLGTAQGFAQKSVDVLPEGMKGAIMAYPAASVLAAGEEDNRQYADSMIDFYKNRYGSIDQALQTLESDPVGVLADASMFTVGGATTPIKNAPRAARKALTPASTPTNMYQSVAKFSTTLSESERAAMISTALKHGIAPTPKGLEKLGDMIRGLNSGIDELISASVNSGGTIPRQAVYKHIKELRRQRGGFKFRAADDIKYIDEAIKSFEEYAKTNLADNMTAADLQAFKVDLYDQINWDARHLQGTPAKEATLKSVARGAKEGVEQLVPEVAVRNKQLAELYELQPALERAANRIANKNPVGLEKPMEVAAGSAAGAALGIPEVGTAVGTVSAILGIDKIKAARAIRLHNLLQSGWMDTFMKANPNVTAAELLAIVSEKTTAANQQSSRQE